MRGKFVSALLGAASLVSAVATAPNAAPAAAGSGHVHLAASAAVEHLDEILDRSPAPYYRRFGSDGMLASAEYAESVLVAAGFDVLRHGGTGDTYTVDYAPGHEPLLERTSDGTRFPAEAALFIESPTGPDGITCMVRAVADVTPGDCGLVPFEQVSPEWKNPFVGPSAVVDEILANGGIGAVLQGDVARNAVIAVKVRRPIAAVIAPVTEGDVIGQEVRLRAMGTAHEAVLHNVVAVRPPADPADGYLVLQAHLDGYFEAAVDNGTGAAAILAAAERLAATDTARGLLIVLYDGEEWGLLGSEALFADLASPAGVRFARCGPVVHAEDVVAVVNLDASSAKPSDVTGPLEERIGSDVPLFSWRAMVYSEEPVIASLFIAEMAANQVLGLALPVEAANPVNGGMTRTDGRWFHEAGIPVAWPVAGYPEYHTSADVASTVDPVDLQHVADGAYDLMVALDTAPVGRLADGLGAPGSVDPDLPVACGAVDDPTAGTSGTSGDGDGDDTTGGGGLPQTGAEEPRMLLVAAAFLVLAVFGHRLSRAHASDR